jgi:hypothetical protein
MVLCLYGRNVICTASRAAVWQGFDAEKAGEEAEERGVIDILSPEKLFFDPGNGQS